MPSLLLFAFLSADRSIEYCADGSRFPAPSRELVSSHQSEPEADLVKRSDADESGHRSTKVVLGGEGDLLQRRDAEEGLERDEEVAVPHLPGCLIEGVGPRADVIDLQESPLYHQIGNRQRSPRGPPAS